MADPFDTLGIDPRFDLDLGAVERRFRELSRVVHPDKFAASGAGERRRALGRAVDVNEAFRAVRDPIRRAEALLRRAGVTFTETSQPKPSPALLMDFMELREELSEARKAKKLDRVSSLTAQIKARETGVLSRLASRLDQLVAAPDKASPADHEAALSLLGELRYIRRFLEEVAAIEEELGEQS